MSKKKLKSKNKKENGYYDFYFSGSKKKKYLKRWNQKRKLYTKRIKK